MILTVLGVLLLLAIVWVLKAPSPDSASKPDTIVDSQKDRGLSDRKRPSSSSGGPVTLDEKFDASLYMTVNHLDGPIPSPDRLFVRVPSTSSRVELVPNSQNEFPVQPAGLKETVALRVAFPDLDPGTPVAVVILDGGSFPSQKEVSQLIEVEKWGGVEFQFTTSANLGHHRLQVSPRGHLPKLLDIYAASDPLNAPL